jgi:uncharacterized membrane protein YphA (DoxX/SURF4 family)
VGIAVAVQLGVVVLRGVFLLAGVTKLLDRHGAEASVIGFGLAPRLARPVARVLPIVEVAIGIGLLVPMTAWWSALAAAVLLLAFTAVIAHNLALGRAPGCHCFGRLSAGLIGARTLQRNAVFILVATLLLWLGEPGGLGS